MNENPHCLVVAGDTLVRAGLRGLLESTLITCSTSDHSDAASYDGHDIVVLHLDSATSAESLTEQLNSTIPVVVTSDRHDGDFVLDVLAAGTLCFVAHPDLGPIELTLAVREALRGRRHVSPAAASALLGSLRAATGSHRLAPSDRLSRRELEVMALVGDGADDAHVAAALGIAVKTVQNHLQTIYVKHDIHSRGEVVAWWQGRLEVDPTDWAMSRDNDL